MLWPYLWIIAPAALGALAAALLITQGWEHLIPDVALTFGALAFPDPRWSLVGVAVVALARRWPPTARCLAHLTCITRPRWLVRTLYPGALQGEDAPLQPIAPLLPLAPIPPVPLLRAQWVRAVNDDPTAPHLAILGPTRVGKTTLATFILAYRPGWLVICTPKKAATDPWAGADVVRLAAREDSISYAPIVQAIEQVFAEMLRRNAQNTTDDERLTLVVDELGDIMDEAPQLREKFVRLWKMGASCKITVIVIDGENAVEAWKIAGRGGVREHLLFIGMKAPERSAHMYRVGPDARPDERTRRQLDLAGVAADAQRLNLTGRTWPRLSVWVQPGGALPVGEQQIAPPQTDRQTTGAADREAKIAKLTRLRGQGWTREECAEILTFDNDLYTEAGRRLKAAGRQTTTA